MHEQGDGTTAARAAAVAFVIAGLVSVISGLVGASGFTERGVSWAAVAWSGAAAMFVAGIAWVLPWRRWHPRTTMVLAGVAVALIATSEVTSRSSRTVDGLMANATVLTLLFVWIGLTQPRGWSAASAPVVGAAMVTALSAAGAEASIVQLLLTVGLAAFIGELIAWVVQRDRDRANELGVVVDATAALRADLGRDETADRIAQAATAMLHAHDVAVYLRDDAGLLRLCALEGAGARVHERRPPPEIPGGISSRTRDGHVELVIPLAGRRGVHGLVVVSGRRVSDEFTMRLAQLFGDQVGGRLDDLVAFEALTDVALRDALTGVGNRRFATALLDDLQPGDAVTLVDLDDLRGVNEHAGHAGGDRLLRDVAAHLRRSVRDADTVARLGGDEFLVVFRAVGRGASSTVARVVADWNGACPGETFSAGVAVHDGSSPEDTLRRADEALYRAKHDGRARIRTAPPEQSPEPAPDPAE